MRYYFDVWKRDGVGAVFVVAQVGGAEYEPYRDRARRVAGGTARR